LLGAAGAKGRSQLIQQDNGQSGSLGFRVANWKLLRHPREKANNLVVQQPLALTPVPRLQLFDLSADPGEKKNVAEAHPERVARLKARLDEAITAGRTRPSSDER
jgi:arylsulfatase A